MVVYSAKTINTKTKERKEESLNKDCGVTTMNNRQTKEEEMKKIKKRTSL